MAKKGPLNKVEMFYIECHHETVPAIDLAKDLSRTVKSVESYINKVKSKPNERTTKIKDDNSLTAGEQMIRHKGSVVMTENASTISDGRRKAHSYKNKEDRITTIK